MLKIDLSKNGIIEAHAGTGKTWTIVNNIVIPALCGDNGEMLHIRDLLLVTYTEKAAGELKERIRKGIEERLKKEKEPNLKSHLENCLNTFHEAYIGTIHSVCLRLIQNYPFECGLPLSIEVVDDILGLNSNIGEILRALPIILGINKEIISKVKIEPENLKERIIETASYLVNSEVLLYPISPNRPITNILSDLEKREEIYSEIISIINKSLENIKILSEDSNSLEPELLKKLEEIYTNWTYITKDDTSNIAKNIKCKGKNANYLYNFISKTTKEPNTPLLLSICENYKNLFTIVSTEEFERYSSLEYEFTLHIILQTAPLLCKIWQEKKIKEGHISFPDMLFFIHKAINNNENFRRLLRKKFKIAVIDEFQDTGVLQWEIFKRIFLDEVFTKNSSKLFIVGDPKQSIYSFQNAVVESYLDACEIMNKLGECERYNLIENYRTTEKLIEAYNILFTHDNNFFCSDRIKYEKENLVKVASCHKNVKITEGSDPIFEKPLKIVPIYGRKYQRILQYSLFITNTIKKLYGTTVKIPEGNGWKTITLDYNHFAVISESHNIADMILKNLLENNIPATKYKHEGIFSSKMATHFRILLNAIKSSNLASSDKIKSFLTDFFGYKPHELSLETISEIEEKVNVLFSKWHVLAKEQRWTIFFKSIMDESGIKERLINTPNGERYLSDLRQIVDYSLEMLLNKKYTLDELIEHLFALSEGYETAQSDTNIYARESDKEKVQVMTIHASKGLEFPVCFVATTNNSSQRSKTKRWVDRIDKTRRCIYVMPSEVTKIPLYKKVIEEKENIIKKQEEMERRRLLYVAITRAKLLLSLPMHLDSLKEKEGQWKTCKIPQKGETILTPLLKNIADLVESKISPYADCIEISYVPSFPREKTRLSSSNYKNLPDISHKDKLMQIEEIIKAIKKIDIPSRRNILTSYTAIAHKDRLETTTEIEKQSDEQHIENIPEVEKFNKWEIAFPYGAQTGIAFHKAIEFILSLEKWNEVLNDYQNNVEFKENIKLILDNSGILKKLTEDKKELMIEKLIKILSNALSYKYNLPNYGNFSVSELNCKDFKTEVEFNIADGQERVIGYIDLLFRIKLNKEEYKYFIIDWKSNYLEDYSPKAIEEDIKNSLYDIQAKLYCYALHRWLSIILGKRYNPDIHLGGALYVYLRGFETPATLQQPYWFYKAEPVNDESFFKTVTKEFIKKSNYVS